MTYDSLTRYRVNVRVLCSRAYHALFMKNMLVEVAKEDLTLTLTLTPNPTPTPSPTPRRT